MHGVRGRRSSPQWNQALYGGLIIAVADMVLAVSYWFPWERNRFYEAIPSDRIGPTRPSQHTRRYASGAAWGRPALFHGNNVRGGICINVATMAMVVVKARHLRRYLRDWTISCYEFCGRAPLKRTAVTCNGTCLLCAMEYCDESALWKDLRRVRETVHSCNKALPESRSRGPYALV